MVVGKQLEDMKQRLSVQEKEQNELELKLIQKEEEIVEQQQIWSTIVQDKEIEYNVISAELDLLKQRQRDKHKSSDLLVTSSADVSTSNPSSPSDPQSRQELQDALRLQTEVIVEIEQQILAAQKLLPPSSDTSSADKTCSSGSTFDDSEEAHLKTVASAQLETLTTLKSSVEEELALLKQALENDDYNEAMLTHNLVRAKLEQSLSQNNGLTRINEYRLSGIEKKCLKLDEELKTKIIESETLTQDLKINKETHEILNEKHEKLQNEYSTLSEKHGHMIDQHEHLQKQFRESLLRNGQSQGEPEIVEKTEETETAESAAEQESAEDSEITDLTTELTKQRDLLATR